MLISMNLYARKRGEIEKDNMRLKRKEKRRREWTKKR